MAAVIDRNRAKIARRVVEVLDYFDHQHQQVTVMDIVRRYDRPQSSTSELLASLVELGLLYRAPDSRHYSLTPRAAILGSMSQPGMVRDGRLSMLIDRLVAQTGLGVVLLGMVGLNAQVFCWMPGSRYVPRVGRFRSGGQEPLSHSAAGLLLLSTLKPERRSGILHRLNAEAPADRKFSHAEMMARVHDHCWRGHAIGPAGFGGTAETAAILLPGEAGDHPMALGFVYEPGYAIDPEGLVALLKSSAQRCIANPAGISRETAESSAA